MGSSVYGSRDLVAVKPFGLANFLFGFYTNTTEAQRTLLGQVPALKNGDYIPGLVIGANSPKPARVSKHRTGGGQDSTFCDITKIDDARAAGWKVVQRPTIRRGSSSKLSKAVFVKIGAVDENGNESGPQIKYAWNMPMFLHSVITPGDLTALGIAVAGKDDTDLVFGARYPTPPKAKFISVAASGSVGSRTTFCDPAKLDNLPTGWSPANTSGYV